jgi:hypothetical protein
MRAVLAARRERVLGDLNPLPFPAQVANAAGWLGYSYVLASTDLQASAMLFWVSSIFWQATDLLQAFACIDLACRLLLNGEL